MAFPQNLIRAHDESDRLRCQSARKRDPGSARKKDPFDAGDEQATEGPARGAEPLRSAA